MVAPSSSISTGFSNYTMSRLNHIYVGPNLPAIGLKQFTLYLTSKPPELLAEFIKLKPAIGSLYIPTMKLAKTRGKLQEKGSLEQQASQQLTALAKAYQASQTQVQPSTT